MKKLEKIGKSVLALSVLANTFMPLGIVSAEDPQPYTISITTSNTGWTVGAITGGIQVVDTSDIVGYIEVRDKSTNTAIEPHGCHDNVCLYTDIAANKTVNITYNSETFDVTTTGEGGCLVDPGYDINGNLSVDVKPPALEPIDKCVTPSSDPAQVPFDGKAVLVWSCNNKICYKEFTGLDQGTKIFYYQASSIKADNYPTAEFDVHADMKFFAAKSSFDKKKDAIDASNAASSPTIARDELVGQDGIDFMPVNEPTENNAYVSYGNRNFKAIIYNDKFKALKMGNFESLHYFPGAWNEALTRRESFDISDTTKANPVEFEMPLLESKFRLKVDEIGGLTVKSITPLDVPEGAVTVNKVDSEYEFKFNSRFYNKVVFKLVDEDDKEYFFRINRQAMSIKVDGDKVHDWTIYSDVYFDRGYNWDDLNITIKVVYKDGTSKLVEMENAKHIDDGLGNSKDIYENDEEDPARTEWPVGRGLKRAVFKANFTNDEIKKVDKMYINIEYKSESNTFYAGNYAGSGKGEVIDFSGSEEYQRRMN